MDIPTIPGAVYTISSASSCDVTDKASGQLLGTATSGAPFTTPAYSDALTLSDPDALYVQIKTFNFALAALGLLGGGVSTGGDTPPAGYIQCDFLESNADSLIWFAAPTPATSAEIELDLQYTRTKDSTQATCGIAGHTGNWAYVDANSTTYKLYSALTGTNALERSVLLFKWQATPDNPNFPGKTTLITQGITSTATARNTTEATGVAMLNYDNGAFRPYYSYARVWSVRAKVGDWEVKGMPCLNAAGVPVMYDSKSKTDYKQTKGNNFIAGFTLPQARKLSKLPATGGTLTISLPSNWQEDEGVINALATAEANGWVITYQTYEADSSTASTFALRRIFVRKTQDENGQYVAQDGSRWHVEWCAGMIGAEPTDHGYEPFRSVDAAVSYWELFPWVDPESEEMMQNEFLTNSTTP